MSKLYNIIQTSIFHLFNLSAVVAIDLLFGKYRSERSVNDINRCMPLNSSFNDLVPYLSNFIFEHFGCHTIHVVQFSNVLENGPGVRRPVLKLGEEQAPTTITQELQGCLTGEESTQKVIRLQ